VIKEALASASATLAKPTINIPTPNLPHINWYMVGACFIVAGFLISFWKKNALVMCVAGGIVIAVALKIGH